MYRQIYDFENLYKAFKQASRGKRYNQDILQFKKQLEENLINIQNHLIYKTYNPKPFREFYIYDPKKRLISAPAFEDRVVHHALCNIMEPIFEKRFIFDSYACRRGKGTHIAVKRVHSFVRPNDYVLKCDIAQYFPSVNHAILLQIIRKTIRCEDTLWFINNIVNHYDGGLPIGALTSQLFANAYLDILDHYIKDGLGVKRYVRYMDDFVIIHKDKAYLKHLKALIEGFLNVKLALKLNNKTAIFPAKHGIDFCGYRIWKTHIKMRKRNVKRTKGKFKKFNRLWNEEKLELKKVRASLMSFLGYAKHSNDKRTINAVVGRIKLYNKAINAK